MTKRRELALEILKLHPKGLTDGQMWSIAFESEIIPHDVSPDSFYNTLISLEKEGGVIREGKHKNCAIIWALPKKENDRLL